MKKRAFTCTACGRLVIPTATDNWKGFAPCRYCGSMQDISSSREGVTAPRLYHERSKEWGLAVSTILELQKRGLLPRDLAACTGLHADLACAIHLALSSEEILRAALVRIPKPRREKLLHPVSSDGLLTKWQRYVLDRYAKEYREELRLTPPAKGVRQERYGNQVTGIPEMVLDLEALYGLPAATTRGKIKELKKVAYNRVRREFLADGSGKGGDNATT